MKVEEFVQRHIKISDDCALQLMHFEVVEVKVERSPYANLFDEDERPWWTKIIARVLDRNTGEPIELRFFHESPPSITKEEAVRHALHTALHHEMDELFKKVLTGEPYFRDPHEGDP